VPNQPESSDESELSNLLASLFAPGQAARPQAPADRPEPAPAAPWEPVPPARLEPAVDVWSEPPTAPSLPTVAAEPAIPADLSPRRPSFTPIATWTAQLGSDRAYYDRMRAVRGLYGADIAFPDRTVERRIVLAGKQMRIGRRSAKGDLNPEIDTADPGVSRLHAVLIAAQDGSWAILDSGSANGTYLNDRKIAKGDVVTLREGDLITLGAWTAITIRRG